MVCGEEGVSVSTYAELQKRYAERLESSDRSIEEFCRYAELANDCLKALNAADLHIEELEDEVRLLKWALNEEKD